MSINIHSGFGGQNSNEFVDFTEGPTKVFGTFAAPVKVFRIEPFSKGFSRRRFLPFQ